MTTHNAGGQMLGYLYQVRTALLLLLKSSNPDFEISIEKFDDVAFEKNGTPVEMIQVKHHINGHTKLTDNSIDLWRTLKVWIDLSNENPSLYDKTNFYIITTSVVAVGSVCELLKKINDRDIEKVYEKLLYIAEEHIKNESSQAYKYYHTFYNSNKKLIKSIVNRIYIIDGATQINNYDKELIDRLKWGIRPGYEKFLIERLEGWWCSKMIDALCSETPILITQNQVRSIVYDIGEEYRSENLPIDEFNIEVLDENEFLNKIFYKQLKIICMNDVRMRICIRDYYRAYQQRSKWVRENLIYVDELEKYEERLVDEWEHAFQAMLDELDVDTLTEKEKARNGRIFYGKIENMNINIRPKCTEPFVMRGNYHMLADKLKVGWHVDFLKRLENLLTR